METFSTLSSYSSIATAHSLGRDHTTEEWESFQFRFGFVLEHGVQIPFLDASLYNPPEGKVSILIALFEAGLRLPTIDFFNLIIHECGFFVRDLTPIAINKIMGFELLCRALGRLPTVPAFNDLVVLSYPRAKVYIDRAPTRFGADNDLADALKKININGEDWLDFFLVSCEMSVAWRARGKMPEFFIEKEGIVLLRLFFHAPCPFLIGKERFNWHFG
ncbi:unnamed protein product [Lactuca saligna]|uniref:Uncharacterized protein n=1 Tax=Lactuca saligna TaxID=75948 RepID=A0AA35YKW9_LACSI|nr:unnamed protein product [Lactuca saligna]